MHIFTYSSRGAIKGVKVGSGSFMLSVTSTPTSAEIAGTSPSPYLVTERENMG